ncbi:hypothetical protein D3C86_1733430 [compost metagenome]
MLKGLRVVSGPLPAGVRYRIETSRDGKVYFLCQEAVGPVSQGVSGVGFDPMEAKAFAKYVRLSFESGTQTHLLLNDFKVFAED